MDIFQSFENQRVLIVGDVMLDRYLMGSVARISPEAPVPVVLHQRTENRLGGAANVALNVRALGGEPVLCSVVGQDEDGKFFCEILPKNGIAGEGIMLSATRRTTVKTRILGNNQQMLRIDREDTHDLTEEERIIFLRKIEGLLDRKACSVVIFQDYNKGVLTEEIISAVVGMAKSRGIPTAVDPKLRHFFAYRGVDLFKPNLKEMRDSAPFPIAADAESLARAASFLQDRLQNRLTMITLSEKGLFLSDDAGSGAIYPTQTRNVADVSGAGDTVISIAAMGLAAGLDLPTIAALSNLAGGQVCQVPGVAPVNLELLREAFGKG